MSWGGYIPGSLLREWEEQGVLQEKLDSLVSALYSENTTKEPPDDVEES